MENTNDLTNHIKLANELFEKGCAIKNNVDNGYSCINTIGKLEIWTGYLYTQMANKTKKNSASLYKYIKALAIQVPIAIAGKENLNIRNLKNALGNDFDDNSEIIYTEENVSDKIYFELDSVITHINDSINYIDTAITELKNYLQIFNIIIESSKDGLSQNFKSNVYKLCNKINTLLTNLSSTINDEFKKSYNILSAAQDDNLNSLINLDDDIT